jgi:hypothetical protein
MATLKYSVQQTFRRPLEVVKAHFLDMRHHIEHNVHGGVRYTILDESGGKQRVRQQLKVMGLPATDVLLLYSGDEQTVIQDFVGGFFKGARLTVRFTRESADVTRGEFSFDLPLPGWKGLIRSVIRNVVAKEAARALEEDRIDLEERGYQPRAAQVAAAA